MAGGLGNDAYVVDVATDVVTEAASAGTDEVRTALASYTLGANVENLVGTAATGQALTGNTLANAITGGAGNDTLSGGAGADTMAGGLGNDAYVVEVATDVVTEAASAGTDEVRTDLASYTLGTNVETLTYTGASTFAGTGNTLDNLLVGGSGNDTLSGSSGNDTLSGGGGSDSMTGGAGNDVYVVDVAGDVVVEAAAEGTDEVRTGLASYTLGTNVENLVGTAATGQALTGNTLANALTGGAGNDTLSGGAGADTMTGGLGNDVYLVDVATDVVTEAASAGTDEIRTGLASYTLASNVENLFGTSATGQTLTGNAQANVITGGGGNDTLNGAAENDTLVGGAGTDIAQFASARQDYSATESAGVISLTKTSSGEVYTISAVEQFQFSDGVITASQLIGGGSTGTAGADTLTGTAGPDSLSGLGGNDSLSGMDGNDTLDGGTGSDTMVGGLGNDIYIVDAATDVVTEASGAGTDEVRTGLSYTLAIYVENLVGTVASGQALTGNALANVVTGSGGADTLDGGAGADTMQGGLGNDVYLVDVATDVVTEAASAGTDEVRTALASYTLALNVENLVGTAATGQALTGNTLANALTGGAGNDTLSGGTGADTMTGGLGNDVYVVDAAVDVVTEAASAGTDEVRTDLASYTLGTNVENLVGTAATGQALTGNTLANALTGGVGNDTLSGGAGSDTLTGGAGNDRLIASTGDDQLYGGADSDTFVFDANNGNDYIYDFETNDVLEISNVPLASSYSQVMANAFEAGGNTAIDFGGPDGVWLVGILKAQLSSSNFMFGTQPSIINGDSGANTLTGTAGSDTIDGKAGDDTINGGGGNDRIIAGQGNDQLYGEAGNDTFVFAASNGNDYIFDFTPGSDKLELQGVTMASSYSQVMANSFEVNGSTAIDFGGPDGVWLVGVMKAQLQASDFIFL